VDLADYFHQFPRGLILENDAAGSGPEGALNLKIAIESG
jgi:hypothetical protein